MLPYYCRKKSTPFNFQEAMDQGCDQVLWIHGRNLQISEVRSLFEPMVTFSYFILPARADPYLYCY